MPHPPNTAVSPLELPESSVLSMLFSLQPVPDPIIYCTKKISQTPLLLVILPTLQIWVNKMPNFYMEARGKKNRCGPKRQKVCCQRSLILLRLLLFGNRVLTDNLEKSHRWEKNCPVCCSFSDILIICLCQQITFLGDFSFLSLSP